MPRMDDAQMAAQATARRCGDMLASHSSFDHHHDRAVGPLQPQSGGGREEDGEVAERRALPAEASWCRSPASSPCADYSTVTRLNTYKVVGEPFLDSNAAAAAATAKVTTSIIITKNPWTMWASVRCFPAHRFALTGFGGAPGCLSSHSQDFLSFDAHSSAVSS